jgi:hypothetical protein
MLQTLLQAAMFASVRGDAPMAINYLSEARAIARKGDTQKMRCVAVHCTIAIHALLPEAVGYGMFQQEHSAVPYHV